MDEYRLSDAPVGENLKIIDMNAGHDAISRLHAMGFQVNDEIVRLTNGKWGPILVKNISMSSSKIAVGRGLAEKIIVQVSAS